MRTATPNRFHGQVMVACSLACLLFVQSLFAQAPTTVQLPTVRQFTVDTAVLVPDRGSAPLGGVNSYQSGSNSRGVPIMGRLPGIGRAFNNRAFGANMNSGQARVHATIIDLQEMDAAIRDTDAARRVRERMAAQRGHGGQGDGAFYVGMEGQGDGGLYGGALPRKTESPTQARARYLSENMGRSAVVKPSGEQVKTKASASKSSAASATKQKEPPLILRGIQK